jgi:hypothetical protein
MTDVQTGEEVPLGPVILKSRKFPAGTATEPVDVQEEPFETEQESAVLDMDVGVPARSVTVMVFACWEKTESCVAVQAAGIHDSAVAASLDDEFAFVSE